MSEAARAGLIQGASDCLERAALLEQSGVNRPPHDRGNVTNSHWLFRMPDRRDEIDEELRRLRKLANRVIGRKAIDTVEAVIADLEAEKAALPPGK